MRGLINGYGPMSNAGRPKQGNLQLVTCSNHQATRGKMATFVGLSATALVTPLRCPQPRMMSAVDPEKTFTRSADFFGTGAKVTTVSPC